MKHEPGQLGVKVMQAVGGDACLGRNNPWYSSEPGCGACWQLWAVGVLSDCVEGLVGLPAWRLLAACCDNEQAHSISGCLWLQT